jgi:thiamine pyrophosphokinase
MNILIFLGGEKPSAELSAIAARRADLVIAADSGFDAARDCGIQPHIVTGDFDSISEVPASGCEVIPAPEQDATDFQKALRQLPAEARSIEILGGTGLRSDHFLTNLLIAAGLPPDVTVIFHDNTQSIYRINPDRPFSMDLRPGTTVSLIPFCTCTGVSSSGLHWNLSDVAMGPGQQLGQSNRVEETRVNIYLSDGILYAIVNHPNGLDPVQQALNQ